jgi:hypothetical protein
VEKISLHRCDGVSDERVTGKESIAIVEIYEQVLYVVTDVVVAALVVAPVMVFATLVVVVVAGVEAVVVLAAVVVTADWVASRLVAAVVVVNYTSQLMALQNTAAMLLIAIRSMSVVGYGSDVMLSSHQCAE